MALHVVGKNTEAKKINWTGDWKKDALCKGNGYIIHGTLLSKHNQSVLVGGKTAPQSSFPVHYIGLIVRLKSLPIERCFDEHDGHELVPDIRQATTYILGYLSMDRTKAKMLKEVDVDTFASSIANEKLVQQRHVAFKQQKKSSTTTKLQPGEREGDDGVFEFWADRAKFLQVEFVVGCEMRLKTMGNSIFLDTVGIVNPISKELKVYAGDDNLNNFVSKVDSKQNLLTPTTTPVEHEKKRFDKGDRVDDAEWDQ